MSKKDKLALQTYKHHYYYAVVRPERLKTRRGCLRCGKLFPYGAGCPKYCAKCRVHIKNAHKTKFCIVCNKKIIGDAYWYCSKKCRDTAGVSKLRLNKQAQKELNEKINYENLITFFRDTKTKHWLCKL
jgi:predicted nucleic acid-binding Zn ribbon protein